MQIGNALLLRKKVPVGEFLLCPHRDVGESMRLNHTERKSRSKNVVNNMA